MGKSSATLEAIARSFRGLALELGNGEDILIEANHGMPKARPKRGTDGLESRTEFLPFLSFLFEPLRPSLPRRACQQKIPELSK